MDIAHNVNNLLNDDKKRILEEIALNIVGDIVMLDGDVDTQEVINATDVAMAINALVKGQGFNARSGKYYPKERIQEFFDLHKLSLQSLASQLFTINEADLFKDIDTLGTILFGQQWSREYLTKNDKVILASENSRIILYRAKNGELAIRFPSEEARNAFMGQMKQETIPEAFRKGEQYKNNPKGLTPVCYQSYPRHIYMPSYMAANGEFAINCGSQENRDTLLKLLGLQANETMLLLNGESITSYGDQLFSTFATATQQNAIYFDSSNKIFTQKGSFLKIDTVSGVIIQGQIQDYSDIPVSRQESRFEYNRADEVIELVAPLAPILVAPEPIVVPSEPIVVNEAPLAKQCLIITTSNLTGMPEIDIIFPNQASRDHWHTTFISFAQFLGLAITNDSLAEKSNEDQTTLRLKASNGIGSTGVYIAKQNSSAQFQPLPQIAIEFGDEQLRDMFLASFSISGEQADIYRGNSNRVKAVYFKVETLHPQTNQAFEVTYNEDALLNYSAIIYDTEELTGLSIN
ncbi:hypothetical protein BN59_03520 [Legionella massiliensis]|uniref:Uncharacterized protein n=1 Tax=Legionella massiliensis TaxID=1034943 RepID=A0A078L1S9_9GAMM|nr:hypothetical protein [Legionella massiliensis]CDZ79202.1 hypothetical protein BN59_03520 [Legionella massiliensis]CEE14940.1 hypothetical protein BN1094_03520 [Legionella massiliensis]